MKKGMVAGQIPMTLAGDRPEPPEWQTVQEVVQESISSDQSNWLAFSDCWQVEVYTDGSAPVVNPGGPAGFSCLLVGFKEPIEPSLSSRPEPVARMELAGYIPARTTDPKTSNNRAELAGTLAALLALPYLSLPSYTAPEITIWSDSNLTVKCGNGEWARKKNIDLWLIFDDLSRDARGQLAMPVALRWLKGHAGNALNEVADKLATLAAFNFDQGQYAQLRAAQAATGKEMPGKVADSPDDQPAEDQEQPPTTLATYTIVLMTDLDGGPSASGGPATGHYLLQTRAGNTFRSMVKHPQVTSADEAVYRTLLAALQDLIGRIEARGKSPGEFTLKVTSFRELMVNQLLGSYRVRASTLIPVYMEAKESSNNKRPIYAARGRMV
jgi:ribonuclease HI